MTPNHYVRESATAGYCRDARIVFQPIVDLLAWSVVGVEALARFEDGTPPPVRLAEAEDAGVREELELELIRLAISSARLLPENLFMTMNASGTTVLHPAIDDLLNTLPRRWGLELYEGSTSANLRAIREHVSHLGGKLFVDDAGTASADGARIRALCPDVVKIDRTLFWQLRADPPVRERLEILIAAAHITDARLLVEGVENADQVDLAHELGAQFAQGYYLGIPTAAEDMQEMLLELRRGIGVDTPGF